MIRPPRATDIADLLARHAPTARRLVTAWSGLQALALLHAGRRSQAHWVMAIAPGPGALQALRQRLPQDALLHLRQYPPLPDQAAALRQAAAQGLRADVLLLQGPQAIAAAPDLIDPGGLLLVSGADRPGVPALDAAFETLEATPALLALRPRRAATPLPAPAGRRAIIVLVIGTQAEAEWDITGPSITAYASAIGAELRLVRAAPGLPRPIIKAAARDIAAEYDRFIMMDSDIVIRPHCPDLFALVPPDSVGAFPEGSRIDRRQLTEQSTAFLGGRPFRPETYFNAGVMVLSRHHLHMLDELGRGIVAGTLIEQNLMNVAARRAGHPIAEIPAAFNHIPGGRLPDDWRCGWILHMAGSPKPAFRPQPLWDRQFHDHGIAWGPKPRLGKHLRLPHLAAQAERITGREVHVLDPEDFDYAGPLAMPRLMPEGYAAIWLEPRSAGGSPRRAWADIPVAAEGRWRLRFLPLPGESLPALRFAIGVPGMPPQRRGRMDRQPQPFMEVAAGVPAARVTIFAGDEACGIGGVLVSRMR